MIRTKITLAAAAILSALLASTAQATTTPDPGDYTPAPDGTHLAILYLQRQYANSVYTEGDKTTSKLGLGLDLAILRSVNYFKVGDLPADWQVILPMAHEHTGLTGDTLNSVGDITVGGTVWTLSHPETAEYLGWSAFLTGPTGAKAEEGSPVSNHRYALDLQSGYTRSLGGKWSTDLVGQVELYTKDTYSRIKTDPLYRVIASVRYAATDRTTVEFVGRQAWGTQEQQYGTSILGTKNDTNLLVGVTTNVTPRFNVMAQYADDVHVKSGPRFRGLQTRFVYAF